MALPSQLIISSQDDISGRNQLTKYISGIGTKCLGSYLSVVCRNDET